VVVFLGGGGGGGGGGVSVVGYTVRLVKRYSEFIQGELSVVELGSTNFAHLVVNKLVIT